MSVQGVRPRVVYNSGNNEWYTPPEYIKAAVEVIGGIDLDPASNELANTVVGAAKFYTPQEDGLMHPWWGRVWLNPPYSQPLIAKFCEKLIGHVLLGDVSEACVLVNNATETEWFQNLARHASAICYPRGRVRFWSPSGSKASNPLQGQAVIYMGPRADRFCEVFSRFGFVVKP